MPNDIEKAHNKKIINTCEKLNQKFFMFLSDFVKREWEVDDENCKIVVDDILLGVACKIMQRDLKYDEVTFGYLCDFTEVFTAQNHESIKRREKIAQFPTNQANNSLSEPTQQEKKSEFLDFLRILKGRKSLPECLREVFIHLDFEVLEFFKERMLVIENQNSKTPKQKFRKKAVESRRQVWFILYYYGKLDPSFICEIMKISEKQFNNYKGDINIEDLATYLEMHRQKIGVAEHIIKNFIETSFIKRNHYGKKLPSN